MTTSKKNVGELDKLVEIQMDLEARVRLAQRANRSWVGDPVLPRVNIPTSFGTEADRLVALSQLVLAIYDNLGLPADLGIVSLNSLVLDAIRKGAGSPAPAEPRQQADRGAP